MALDIDGTLLNSRGLVSDANKQAVDAALERGVQVVLVTGRRFSMAEPIAILFDHDLIVVANNGAVVRTSRSHRLLYRNPLPLEAALAVLRATRAFRSSCVAHAEEPGFEQLVCESIDPENRPLQWYLNKSKESVHQVESLENFLTVDPIQLMFGGNVERMNGVVGAVEPLARKGQVRVTKTEYLHRDVSIVDVLSPSSGKAVALDFLLQQSQWTHKNLMAVGDNHNDHDMLELATVAVVMGQSVEGLKTAGRYVTASNDENGVAQAIERFVLDRKPLSVNPS
ncbi:MAG: Cof-type HAD-IIB family hydrolase [Acidobacteriia bacterium]|nr:Cof-type HAD-IIB family hydrolase [Terriglobia bacterium]